MHAIPTGAVLVIKRNSALLPLFLFLSCSSPDIPRAFFLLHVVFRVRTLPRGTDVARTVHPSASGPPTARERRVLSRTRREEGPHVFLPLVVSFAEFIGEYEIGKKGYARARYNTVYIS